MRRRLSKESLFLGLMVYAPEVFREYVTREEFRPEGFEDVLHQELCRVLKTRAGKSKAPTVNAILTQVEDGEMRAEMKAMLANLKTALMGEGTKVPAAEAEEAEAYFQPIVARGDRVVALRTLEVIKERLVKAGDDREKVRSAMADVIKKLTMQQLSIGTGKRDRRPVKLLDGLETAFLGLNEGMKSNGQLFYSTGLIEIDQLFDGGLRPGELYYGIGRPGSGKSVFGQRVAIGTALSGVPTAFLSAEMTLTGCFLRVLSCLTDILPSRKGLRPVPLRWLRNPKLLQGQTRALARLDEVLDQIGDLPLYYVDLNGATTDELWTITADLVNNYGVRVIVGDYAQLMKVKGGADMSDVKMNDIISENLREMTLAYNIASFWLAQASRSVENRQDKRLTMSDIRGSGKYEADAHGLVSFYREEYYLKEEATEPNTMEVTAHKMRDAELGTVKLYFGGPYSSCDNYRPGAVVPRSRSTA